MKNFKKDNLVLIGYRGSGKSAASRILSDKLRLKALSIDNMITERSGLPITDLVSEKGWTYFRNLETDIIKEVSQHGNTIIDCGGGVIEKPENMESLKKRGLVFFLDGHAELLAGRLKHKTDRPALTEHGSFLSEIHDVLKIRRPLYLKFCDYRIDISHNEIKKTTSQIKSLWQYYQNTY